MAKQRRNLNAGKARLPRLVKSPERHKAACLLPAQHHEGLVISSALDWERLPLHLETIHEDLKHLPWVLLEPGSSQGSLVHDPFGRTVHGTDSKLCLGRIYRIGKTEMEWHSAPVPTLARILRICSASEAHRFGGRSLVKRKYYYEVLVD